MPATSIAFSRETHLDALHAFVSGCWRQRGPAVAFHVGDLHWRLRPRAETDPAEDLRLWIGDGRILGFAWFERPDQGDFQLGDGPDRLTLTAHALDWLESKAADRAASSLTVGCFDTDDDLARLLEARGYASQPGTLRHLLRSLDESIETASPAEGFRLAPLDRSHAGSLAVAMADAFGAKPRPAHAYEELFDGNYCDRSLTYAACDDNGEIAAFCIGWPDAANGVGLLEPVGCRPAFRRRGLASAVISATLRAMRDAGLDRAVVYPHGEDAAAVSLYERNGFSRVADDRDWRRELA